jgi:hypothetical protein
MSSVSRAAAKTISKSMSKISIGGAIRLNRFRVAELISSGRDPSRDRTRDSDGKAH